MGLIYKAKNVFSFLLRRYHWWYTPLLLIPFFIFCGGLAWWYQNSEIQRRLDLISACGHPITLEELNEYYVLPPNAENNTTLWLSALRFVEANTEKLDAVELPFMGDGPEPPPRGETWLEKSVAEDYLQECTEALLALHEAAHVGGQARLKQDFSEGVGLQFRDAYAARTAARLLMLEAHFHARSNNGAKMIDSLRAVVATGNALKYNPVLVPYLVRLRINDLFLDNIPFLLRSIELPRPALVQLQEELRNVEYHEDLHRAMIGERIMGLDFFGLIDSEFGIIRERILGLAAPRAKIKYIDIMNEIVTKTNEPWPDLMKSPPLEQKFNLNPRNPFHLLATSIVPILDEVFTDSGSQLARLRALDAAIAAELYRRDHGQPPTSLEELVPDYLPTIPIDPFTGDALQYKTVDDGFLVYGLGKNLTDDGGDIANATREPLDIGIRWGGTSEEPQEAADNAEESE